MGTALRFVTYAILAPLAPVVRFVLLLGAFAGFASCLVYRVLLHAPHFPLGVMLVLSAALCLAAASMDLLVDRLASG